MDIWIYGYMGIWIYIYIYTRFRRRGKPRREINGLRQVVSSGVGGFVALACCSALAGKGVRRNIGLNHAKHVASVEHFIRSAAETPAGNRLGDLPGPNSNFCMRNDCLAFVFHD